MSALRDEVNFVFRNVFADPSIEVSETTTAADIPGWDSLTHMHLISEIERHFGIRFTFREASAFANVGDLLQAIRAKSTV